MKSIIKGKRGYLLVYFLISAAIVAMFWTMSVNKQKRQIERDVKSELVSRFLYEVNWNISRAKRYKTMSTMSSKYGTGKQKKNKVIFKTHATKFFVSRMMTAFRMNVKNRDRLQTLVDKLRFYHILNEEGKEVEIDKNHLNDIVAIYEELKEMLDMSKKHNYNFTF